MSLGLKNIQMKKKINNKMCNTATATKVASYDFDKQQNDPNFCIEELYRTKKGDWFLYGRKGSSIPKVSAFLAISQSQALLWLINHNKTDAIVIYFIAEIEEAIHLLRSMLLKQNEK